MHSKQGWREKTEDGQTREVRAKRLGVHWRIQSRLKGEDEWTEHDPPSIHDLESLLDLLKRRYQRRGVSMKQIENVEKMIEERRYG